MRATIPAISFTSARRPIALPLALALLCCCLAQGADPVWEENFDSANPGLPVDTLTPAPGRGGTVHIRVAAGTTNPGRTVFLPVPIEKIRGKRVFLGAEVKGTDVSAKPNSWNGVKVMLVIETPSGKSYPQPEIPTGTFDWKGFTTRLDVPDDATNAVLVLGLEAVTGEAWFDNVGLVPGARFQTSYKADPARPVFRGHNLPRLRGAMAGTALTEEDVKYFATTWQGNLLRLQIFEAARDDRPLETYDAWLEQRLRHIDRVLDWCGKYRVHAVIDLHSPPGGQAFSAGYITARGRIFTQPAAQAKFIEVWEQIARRYRGREMIWGFDLVNEPDDSMLGEGCMDWNTLADRAARAVRAVDPNRTIIIEPNQWGSARGFEDFEPLDLPNVVYSFHFYEPMKFTHQGIHNNPAGVAYPGLIAGERWDRAALERALRPAIAFAQKHRVHLYVGEFSAIRTAPGDSAAKYLGDLIGLFEEHGWDWSYHAYREWQGWSLEHEGPLDQPVRAQTPTDRQKVVVGWFARNAGR